LIIAIANNFGIYIENFEYQAFVQIWAAFFGKSKNSRVLVVPRNLFSDETIGNVSFCYLKYKNFSFTVAILLFQNGNNLNNSYLLSSAD
jgi:hypothetical protein